MKTNRRIMLLILFIAGHSVIFTLQAQNREERKELKETDCKRED